MAIERRASIERAVSARRVLLEAEGSALGRTARTQSYRVVAQPEGDGLWKPEKTGKVSSILQTKNGAETSARELAKVHKPSQIFVYNKDGTVQAEHTYGWRHSLLYPVLQIERIVSAYG